MARTHVRYRILLFYLPVIGVFNGLDFVATQVLVVQGGHFELNPFMNWLIGTPYFALYKLVLVPIGLLFLWFVRKTLAPRYLVWVKLTAGVYIVLMVYNWMVFYS
ncbi:MAG: hypothetical protein GX979_05670 [Firmicutes bacterium]|nr:hypothetical protein [Bacillota bacterium]